MICPQCKGVDPQPFCLGGCKGTGALGRDHMSPREVVLQRARRTYADAYVDRVALAAPTDQEAATALSRLLRNGGFGSPSVRVEFSAQGIHYEVDGETGRLTYLDLAREIRSAQGAFDFGGAA